MLALTLQYVCCLQLQPLIAAPSHATTETTMTIDMTASTIHNTTIRLSYVIMAAGWIRTH
jgi:hypothetical protein